MKKWRIVPMHGSIAEGSIHAPALSFFCELDQAALARLFADPIVIEHIRMLNAGICIGLRDLSTERAAVVRHLNEAGVPLTAWLLLPEDQGYWFNINNAPEAAARYAAFRMWTAAHALRWQAVGLDIEFDMRDLQAALANRRHLVRVLLRNLFNTQRRQRAIAAYGALAEQIRADGYRTESYTLPFVLDERRVGSSLLSRLLGLADVPVDCDIPMLYSSFLRPYGTGVVWSYGRNARAIAIGSTGGGVSVGGADRIAPLSWEELARDLRLARRQCDAIAIFSLEGCVREGYLERLRSFNWDAPVEIPARAVIRIECIRALLRSILWISARAPQFALATGTIATVLWMTNRHR
ncbi:hypothetical protein [Roseiflexus castenholzii]|uniref:hypothetical protein n=1 Tax=Roseiflexus castenholzii TaxID=120962 RepID=UPI003C7D1A57